MSTHSQNTIRILVVDDHTLFRRGLTALLARDPQLVVVGDAADRHERRESDKATKADKRREFLRVKRNANGGLDLFANQSSGVLTSAVWGDGLVNNPAGQTIAPGDMVQYTAFAEVLS